MNTQLMVPLAPVRARAREVPNEGKNDYYGDEKDKGNPTLKFLAQVHPPNPNALSIS